MESIDDLLAQVKAEYEGKDNPKPLPKQKPLSKADIFEEPSLPPIPQPPILSSNNVNLSTAEYSLIDEIKGEFAAKEKEKELKRQQQIREEQLRQEKIKQQQRQALTKEAQEWLKRLNSRSAEGLWFEEFAYDYPSKLEAAIDYLQALKETKS